MRDCSVDDCECIDFEEPDFEEPDFEEPDPEEPDPEVFQRLIRGWIVERVDKRQHPAHLGTVKWFNRKAGYGFIINTNDFRFRHIFVHYTDIQGAGFRSLVTGQHVIFDVVFDDLKRSGRAVNVAVLP